MDTVKVIRLHCAIICLVSIKNQEKQGELWKDIRVKMTLLEITDRMRITPPLWRQQLNSTIPRLFSGRSCRMQRTECILDKDSQVSINHLMC